MGGGGVCFFFQAGDGIRDLVRSRGLGGVYRGQGTARHVLAWHVLDRHGTARFDLARFGLARHGTF